MRRFLVIFAIYSAVALFAIIALAPMTAASTK
jgi:hypothetical protein